MSRSVDDRRSASDDARPTRVNLLYLIKQLELGVRPLLDEVVATQGLTVAQYTALSVLDRRPGLTSAELARRSLVKAQTMAATSTFLIDQGFAERHVDPQSKRQYLLFPTDAGRAVIAALADRVAAIEDELTVDLTAAQRRALASYLRTCRDSIPRRP